MDFVYKNIMQEMLKTISSNPVMKNTNLFYTQPSFIQEENKKCHFPTISFSNTNFGKRLHPGK